MKKVRRQLDQNLDKLQEAFASCGSSSAAQAKARAIAKDTHEGYKEVVEATLAANLDCVTTRKAMQDSQQLMNWTLEILVDGSNSLGQEKKNEFISSADEVLRQMSAIFRVSFFTEYNPLAITRTDTTSSKFCEVPPNIS